MVEFSRASVQTPSMQKLARTKGEKPAAEQLETKQDMPVREDKFVQSQTVDSVTYSRQDAQRLSADQLKEMQRQQTERFTEMLRSMITKQGEKSNLTLFGMDLTVSQADSAAAAKAIAPGGEYSVEAVSGRILNMAKALAGGDASKIEELREAVKKGFEAAGVDMGGSLPSICQDTYTAVMKGFDDWKAELNPEAE